MIAYSARDIAERLNSKALVAFTTSGDTAKRLSRLRSQLPLLVFTPHESVRSQLALTWGVETFLCPEVASTDEMLHVLDRQLVKVDGYHRDDVIVLVAGTPPGVEGNTNMVHVHAIGEDVRIAPKS